MVQGEIGRMKISACVIVKNEEQNIGRWLANMQQIADEIVVVDTGSTDATLDILTKAGVEPYHFAWCSDFAAAKNYAIQQATGDWIVFLDADEYFDAQSVKRFRQEMAKYHRNKKIAAIMCQLVNIDTDNRNKVINAIIQVRIFRNSKDIRYKNPVHEQLVAEHGRYIMQKCFNLQIMHTGYSTSILRQKAERDLLILKKRDKNAKTKQDKEQLYGFFMDAYNCLGDFAKVLEYSQKAAESSMKSLGGDIHIYECMISAMTHLDKSSTEVLAVIEKARKKYPKEVFFPLQLGYHYYIRHDFLQAETYLLEALKLRQALEAAIKDGRAIVDNSLNILPILYGSLADIYIHKGQKQHALEFALQGISYYKYNKLLAQGLYRSLQGRPPVEVIQIFDCLYDRKADGGFLREAIGWQATKEFATYYYAEDAANMAKLYLKNGNYQGAAAAAGQKLSEMHHLALAQLLAQQEQDERILSLLPDKYKELAVSIQACEHDADGRAVLRLSQSRQHESMENN